MIEFSSAAAAWIVAISAALFVGSLMLIPLLAVWIPSDYFTRSPTTENCWRQRWPVVNVVIKVIKNLLGIIVTIAGLVMLLTPGQGLLAILLGVSMLDIPGKRAVIIRILRRPAVLHLINGLRLRMGRPPLQLPSDQ